jgi:hypothetical protein
VKLDEVLADRQAESEPAVFARERCVRLSEGLEHVRKERFRDPWTIIFHADFDEIGVRV